MGITTFNDPRPKLNILNGLMNVFRPAFKLSANVLDHGDKVKIGRWLKLNSEGELDLISGDTGVAGALILLQDLSHGDVVAFSLDHEGNSFGGYMAVVDDIFNAEVGEYGYLYSADPSNYLPGKPLKVTSAGILAPAEEGDIVTAYARGINERNMLVFTNRGGK